MENNLLGNDQIDDPVFYKAWKIWSVYKLEILKMKTKSRGLRLKSDQNIKTIDLESAIFVGIPKLLGI